jgi:hypothetical protein
MSVSPPVPLRIEASWDPPKSQVPWSQVRQGPFGLSGSLASNSMSVDFFHQNWIPRPARSSCSRKRSSLS